MCIGSFDSSCHLLQQLVCLSGCGGLSYDITFHLTSQVRVTELCCCAQRQRQVGLSYSLDSFPFFFALTFVAVDFSDHIYCLWSQ